MKLDEIVEYWSRFGRDPSAGLWTHPDDRAVLGEGGHTFNLDHPTCPYVGRVATAPVVILGANGGYHPTVTPREFPDDETIDAYLARVASPDAANWSNVAPYYDTVNWGGLIKSGDAVWVNASPYRSPRISEEQANQRLVRRLPSSEFIRCWLLEAVLPLAARGERLVVVKRPGLWRLPDSATSAPGVVVDRVARSKHITGDARIELDAFLRRRGTREQLAASQVPARPVVTRRRVSAFPSISETPPVPSTFVAPVAGMPQGEVEPLVRVCTLLGVELEGPTARWPGYGKVVHLKGGRSIYLNKRHADVRSGPHEIAKWHAAGLGKIRPDNDRYLRVMLDGSGPLA